MKLSAWSSYFIDLTPERMVEEFEKHGYRYCELSDEHALQLMERGNVSEVKKLDYQGLYNLEIPGESRACLEIRKLKLDYIKCF